MMKKSIIIVFLLISICLFPTACKKEKKVGSNSVYPKIEVVNTQNHTIPIDLKEVKVQCKNGFLFKASYSDKLQIKQFNFDTLKEELLGEFSINLSLIPLTLSPDKKKVAFLAQTPRIDLDGRSWRLYDDVFDLYVMSIDGSNIKRITFDMMFRPYGEAARFEMLFTPDSQEVILYNWDSVIYIVNLIKNSCIEYNEDHALFGPMLSYIYQYYHSLGENIPIQSNFGENLVWFSNQIGTFNWINKEYKKIYTLPNQQCSFATWTPDFTKIIYSVDEALFLYDITAKKRVNLSGSEMIENWYSDPYPNPYPYRYYKKYQVIDKGKQVLFLSDMIFCSYNIDTRKTTKFDLNGFQSEPAASIYSDFEIVQLNDEKCMITHQNSRSDSSKEDKSIFLYSSSDLSLKKLPIPNYSSNFVFLDNFLYFTSKEGFARYSFSSNTYQNLYPFELFYNFELPGCDYIREKQLFCFRYISKKSYPVMNSLILDKEGHQIAEIPHIINTYDFPPFYYNEPILHHISDKDFFFFTFQSLPSDLYYAKSIKDKPSNLTQGRYPVLRSELSPDQDKVAFYSLDSIADTASIHLIHLKNPKKVMTLATFQFDYPINSCSPGEYPEDHFLTLTWSEDSQRIYFVTRDASKRFMIYRAKANGKEMTLLSDPKSSSFGSMVSPDGKQIVYVTGEERKIALMNTDGTNKKIISDGIATKQCFFPAWSPDGKMIAFNQLIMEDRRFDTPNLTNQIIIITPQGKVIEKIDCKYINPRSTYPEFYQSRNFWSYSTNYFSCLQSVNNTYAGEVGYHSDSQICVWEKNFFNGEPIEPIIRTFKWAHSKDNLMLFVTQHSNFLDNKIQLFDCKTKQYTTITQYISILSDAAWSPEDSEVLYAGTDMLSGQMVFKVASSDGSYQKLLFTFGENPLEQPSSIADIDELVWLKK